MAPIKRAVRGLSGHQYRSEPASPGSGLSRILGRASHSKRGTKELIPRRLMLDQITHWIAENWLRILGLFTFLTVLPAYFRARYLWRRRMFLTRINFSLNFIEDGVLRFRTIGENDLAHVLLNNAHAIRLV